jgi:transposase
MIASSKTTIGLTEGADGRRAEIRRLLTRWTLVRAQIADVEARLAELVEITPAANALTTIPGVSIVCAATLVAEIGNPGGYESPRQILKLAGMNLARRQSGTSIFGRVRQTKRGRPLLRRQLFLLAGRWCQQRGLYRERYQAMVRGGKSRTNAVCAIARKLVPMLLKVMQTAEPFDAALWLADRRRPEAA